MTVLLWAAFLLLVGGAVLGLAATARDLWRDASARVTACVDSVQPPDVSTEFDEHADEALQLVGDWDAAFVKELTT